MCVACGRAIKPGGDRPTGVVGHVLFGGFLGLSLAVVMGLSWVDASRREAGITPPAGDSQTAGPDS